MNPNTSLEKRRIKHVNNHHDSCDEIYESLIDHDYNHCKKISKELILKLKDMIDSMEDDL